MIIYTLVVDTSANSRLESVGFASAFAVLLLVSLALRMPVMGSGVTLFTRTWGGGDEEAAYGVAVDSSNNAFVTGYTTSFGVNQSDVFLIKYDSLGHIIWQRTWGGNGSEVGYRVAVDNLEDVFVTGSTDSFGANEVFLLKFSSAGNLLWQKTWGGSGTEVATGLLIDSSGNQYVTGTIYGFSPGECFGSQPGCDVFLIKLDPSGNLLWQRVWGGNRTETSHGVTLGDQDSVYVAGYANNTSSRYADAFILKFAANGTFVWQKAWGSFLADDYAEAVATSPSGAFYVAGKTASASGGYFLLRLNPNGAVVFATAWNDPKLSQIASIRADQLDDIFVAGTYAFMILGSNLCSEVPLLKFNSTGSLLWSRGWHGNSSGSCNFAGGLDLDLSGRVLVAGATSSPPPYSIGDIQSGLSGTLNYTVSNLTLPVVVPSIPVVSAPGLVLTPNGNQSYAGKADEFLFKFSPDATSTPITTAQLMVTVGLYTALVALIIKIVPRRIKRFSDPIPRL